MKYRPCPECRRSARPVKIITASYHRKGGGFIVYECPHCGVMYSLIYARNGMLLDTNVALKVTSGGDMSTTDQGETP